MSKQWESVYPYCDLVVDTTNYSAEEIVHIIIDKISKNHIEFISRDQDRKEYKNMINKIGVLTSGGDAPGMNAAIRGVTRYAIEKV